MDTDRETPDGHPAAAAEDEVHDHDQVEVDELPDDTDPSDYDPRSYWDDPTGVDGAIHGDHAEEPVVNADVHDLGDLGDLFPH